MRSALRASAPLAILFLSWHLGSPLSAAASKSPSSTAEPLVQAALEAELAGAHSQRTRLLDEALRRDPDFAPARWQSGFVRIDDQWVELDDVPGRAGADARLATYRQKRDALVDTSDDHRQLARWCKKTGLRDEERVHWAKVLEFNPADAEALKALGIQWHQGRLLSPTQIAQEKTAEGKRQGELLRWRPRLTAWRLAIERGTEEERTSAMENLKALDDPSAIPALEAVLLAEHKGPFHADAARALIGALGRVPNSDATQALLRTALLGEPGDLRTLAAAELKKRPMHAYVPQLIAALPGEVKTRFNVFLLPDGMVVHEHEVLLAGRQANLSLTFESTVLPADPNASRSIAARALNREMTRAGEIESQAQAAERQLAFMRKRVQHVLELTTGFTKVDEPELWQKQYNDYQGWLTPSHERPTYRASNKVYEGYATPPVDQVTTTTRSRIDPNFHMSCFPAGTPVWTLQGVRPIEQVKIGDRVLAQDPVSGELIYKPVQTTTLRAATSLLKIDVGSESILATPGHPFWVVDEGWKTARQLAPSDRLHCQSGMATVRSVEPSRESEVYNFVVADLHNYFVGASRLLVHDNSPIAELAQRVPGLAATATAK